MPPGFQAGLPTINFQCSSFQLNKVKYLWGQILLKICDMRDYKIVCDKSYVLIPKCVVCVVLSQINKGWIIGPLLKYSTLAACRTSTLQRQTKLLWRMKISILTCISLYIVILSYLVSWSRYVFRYVLTFWKSKIF